MLGKIRSYKLLLSFLLIPLLAGCSLLPASINGKKVTLKYWGLWDSATTINQVVADFKKTHPNIDVQYEKKSLQQYRESLQSQIDSGIGPDIFSFHNTWVPMLKSQLEPVPQTVLSDNDFKKNFYPTVITDLRNGQKKFVGVPLEIDGLGLYWNEDIFKAAGIVNPPKTWQELAQDAAKLTVRDPQGNIKTSGIALGTASNVDHFSDILGLMIIQNGGDPKTPDDKYTADALEYYTNFAKGDNHVWDESLPSSTVAFIGNNLAMYFAPSWRASEIKNANPLLNFKIAQVPQLEGNKVGWSSYWAEGVSAKSANKDAAWQFIKYLQEDQTLVSLYSESKKTPGILIGKPYPKVSLADKLLTDPYSAGFIQDAPFMRSFPMASRTSDNGLNDQIIKAYEDAVNATLHGTPAQSALQTAAKNVTTIFGRFNGAPAPTSTK